MADERLDRDITRRERAGGKVEHPGGRSGEGLPFHRDGFEGR